MNMQIWYWGNLADLMTTVKASPVHALEGFKISSKEVSSWSDFVVRVITNVHGSKVRRRVVLVHTGHCMCRHGGVTTAAAVCG